MRKRRFLAALGVTAGLVAGGATAIVLGTPGVSGAQTDGSTTTQPTTPSDQPATPAPGNQGRAGHNCPNMGGQAGSGTGSSGTSTSGGGTGDASNVRFRGRFGGGFARV